MKGKQKPYKSIRSEDLAKAAVPLLKLLEGYSCHDIKRILLWVDIETGDKSIYREPSAK